LRVKLGNGLWLANVLSWLLILVILLFPENPVRIVLGVPFVLFFPGYALITALVPRKTGMSGIERVALTFGLSIALVILIGLALNYTSFGIRLMPMVISMSAALLVLSTTAWVRERRIPDAERYSISFQLSFNSVWSGRPLDKALSVFLALAVLASLGAVAYTIAKPKSGEEFTEFYVLGSGGKAADYPSEVRVGEKAAVTGGIINNFRTRVSYRIAVSVAGESRVLALPDAGLGECHPITSPLGGRDPLKSPPPSEPAASGPRPRTGRPIPRGTARSDRRSS
jgi:uncharacterized membrane protein